MKQNNQFNDEELFFSTAERLDDLRAEFKIRSRLWQTESISHDAVEKLRESIALCMGAANYYRQEVEIPKPAPKKLMRNVSEKMKGVYQQVEDFVATIRLLKKGLSLDQIARYLNHDPQKFRKNFNDHLESGKKFDSNMLEEAFMGRDKVDFISVKDPEYLLSGGLQERKVFIHLNTIRIYEKEGMTPEKIAEKLGCELKEYLRWYRLNRPYLDLLKC